MLRNQKIFVLSILAAFSLLSSAVFTRAEEGPANTATSEKDTIAPAKSETKVGDGNVALVNGVVISQERFNSAMLPYQEQIDAWGEDVITPERLTEIKTGVIETLIATELLYQESQKNGIKVEEKEINDTYDKQKAQFTSEENFQERLKQYGFNDSTFKDLIRQGLLIQHFVDKKFMVSDEEAKKYYTDNPDYFVEPAQAKVSHIMIIIDSAADQTMKDEAKKKVEEVLKRLKAGEDFAALAKEVSEDIETKENGGELDSFYKGQMVQIMGESVQPFEDATFSLKPGEISDIVETGYGYHIIKLIDKKYATTVSYDDSKESIKNYLKDSKVNKYVTELRSNANVEIYLAQ